MDGDIKERSKLSKDVLINMSEKVREANFVFKIAIRGPCFSATQANWVSAWLCCCKDGVAEGFDPNSPNWGKGEPCAT